MLAMRRPTSMLARPLGRLNFALNASSTASEPSDDTPLKTQGRRRRKIPPKRPNISLKNPRKWNRPLGKGVVPAYDLALSLLKADSLKLKAEADQLLKIIKVKEEGYQQLSKASEFNEEKLEQLDRELEEMLTKLKIIQVQSEINLPSVRWKVNNAMADKNKLSHRYLLEQKWRKDGDLDLLMERIYQMNVVPDVLPLINPEIDLDVIVRTKPSAFLTTGKVQQGVEPGVFLTAKQTLHPPKFHVNVFHTDVRLYTMLLVDLDVPDPENKRFTTFLHWMKPNIQLSSSSSYIRNLNTHTTYIPPHPQRGSPYHRYVTLFLLQPALGPEGYTNTVAWRAGSLPTSAHLEIPTVKKADRPGFDVRAFVQKWNLITGRGAVHMWREMSDEDVTKIYRDILKQPEPHYGHPPKLDVYAELNRQKRYSLH